MSPRARALTGYGVAAALLLAGGLLAATAGQPTDDGWFAYTPLGPPAPPLLPVGGWHRLGALALAGAGLLAVAATAGWWWGRCCRPAVRRVLPMLLGGLATAVVVLGIVVFTIGRPDLDGATVMIEMASGPAVLRGPLSYWTPGQEVGAALVLLGALVATAALGSVRARRVRPPAPSPAGPRPAPADPG